MHMHISVNNISYRKAFLFLFMLGFIIFQDKNGINFLPTNVTVQLHNPSLVTMKTSKNRMETRIQQ